MLLLACQPPLAEVETFATTSSGGSSSTAASATNAGTSASADATVGGSGSGGSASGSSSIGAVDSSSSSGSSGDGTGEDPDPDAPLGPFGVPVPLTELNSPYSEDDPTLTADMLEIYFASGRSGTEDVWMSTRASVADAWDAPISVDALNSGAVETVVEVSPDGLFVLLASDRLLLGDQDVYFARRAARGQPWPSLQELPGAANGGIDDRGVTPSPDLASAFLCRAPLGLAPDIYETPADFDAPIVYAAVLVAELSSPQDDCSVSLSPSRREIFLESTRPAGAPGWNLWVATREDPADPWPAPVEVVELDSDGDDTDPWLSPDRHTLVFASTRTGDSELYVATR